MKMKKNNLWNKLFHRKQLLKEKEKYVRCKTMEAHFNDLHRSILQSESLTELLDLHKEAWELGFQNENLDICPYGMFRGDSIPSLTVDQVFIGDCYGLNTKTIRYWNQHSTDVIGVNGFGIDENTKICSLMCRRYRQLLLQNITSLVAQANMYISMYEKKVYDPTSKFNIKW